MSDVRLIGRGTVRDFQWTLEAGGDDEAYWTGLKVTGPDDYRCSGGMAGPKLWGDDLVNTYSARNDGGPVGIAVRASPKVTRVVVRTGGGGEADLLSCGSGVIDDLRFYVGFAWPDPLSSTLGLDELRALDEGGSPVANYDLSFWDRMGDR
jgi:hypothetical protein